MIEKIVERWHLHHGAVTKYDAGRETDKRLSKYLDFLRSDESGWILYYRDRRDGSERKLTFSDSSTHGGGPRTLERIEEREG